VQYKKRSEGIIRQRSRKRTVKPGTNSRKKVGCDVLMTVKASGVEKQKNEEREVGRLILSWLLKRVEDRKATENRQDQKKGEAAGKAKSVNQQAAKPSAP